MGFPFCACAMQSLRFFKSFLGYKLEKDVVIHMKAHPKKSPTCENMEKNWRTLLVQISKVTVAANSCSAKN